MAAKVVYDCAISEVMGYPEQNYYFRRGEDVLLMWSGYFDDLMHGMWKVYGWEPESEEPDSPNLEQLPLLRVWNAGTIETNGPLPIANLTETAGAFRAAIVELRRIGPNLAESLKHGEALAQFLNQAITQSQSVSIEQQWGYREP